jgi:hypothetical protein
VQSHGQPYQPSSEAANTSTTFGKSHHLNRFDIYGRHNPAAGWTSQQLRDAFPFDQAPRYLLRDSDGIFADEFRKTWKPWGSRRCFRLPGHRKSWPIFLKNSLKISRLLTYS